MANVVLINGAGPKAFCAGGDVAALAQQNTEGPSGIAASQAYFGLEYQLDHIIATYPKPYIAYMDGITMGGGVGLSVHAPIRIATEKTLFAMPETTIGFFPDVGGSFFLPRLDGRIGTYLALTSSRLAGVNAFYAGIATHYIDSATLPSLTARLAELTFKDYESLSQRLSTIDATIAEFDPGLPPNEPILLAHDLRAAIDRCFRHSTIETIISALERESQRPITSAFDNHTWAKQTLQTLSERSPTSLRVALRQMHDGRAWSISETFQREYHLAGAFMAHPDFTTGVSARLIHKPPTTPVWAPKTLAEVSDAAIDEMFEPKERRLQLLHSEERAYVDYPFNMGLPREEEVEMVVREGGMTVEGVVKGFLRRRRGRGVEGKVREVLERCTRGEGALVWVGEEGREGVERE